jgi:hypothetical protein
MVNQTYRFLEGIAKDIPVQIYDHFIPTDFLVLDMGEEDHDPPNILLFVSVLIEREGEAMVLSN